MGTYFGCGLFSVSCEGSAELDDVIICLLL